jgi:hypothetical protein
MGVSVNAQEFISQAGGQGPCVGIVYGAAFPLVTPAGFEIRTIDGSRTKTRDGVFDAFADVWHFPPWFGRNMDAFDDFMRDLDNMINTASGKPPAPGYFTHITDADLILAGQPEAFPWFAKCMPFYRDYYRDEASPPAAFGLLLSASDDQFDEVRKRWLSAGVSIATVSSES